MTRDILIKRTRFYIIGDIFLTSYIYLFITLVKMCFHFGKFVYFFVISLKIKYFSTNDKTLNIKSVERIISQGFASEIVCYPDELKFRVCRFAIGSSVAGERSGGSDDCKCGILLGESPHGRPNGINTMVHANESPSIQATSEEICDLPPHIYILRREM